MHIKTQCTNVLHNAALCLVHFVGRAAPELNLGKLGDWLDGEARRSILRKVRAGRPGPLAAKASRSMIQKWCVTETAKLKKDRPVDLLQS